jgi:hypothetical protein
MTRIRPLRRSGLLSADEVQRALFGGHGQGVDFSGASGHKAATVAKRFRRLGVKY